MVQTSKLQATECMRLDISRALDILYDLGDAEKTIPRHYFRDCFGFLFLSCDEVGGILVSGTSGNGILLSHNPRTNEWSSPLSVNLHGLGVGLSVGHDHNDMIVFLHSPDLITKFSATMHIQFGSYTSKRQNKHSNSSVPQQNTISGGSTFEEHHYHGNHASAFSFSDGGHFFCIELEGVVLRSDKKRHRDFYGPAISPRRVLLGGRTSVRCNHRSGVQVLKNKLMQLAAANKGKRRHEHDVPQQQPWMMQQAPGSAVSAV